MGLFLAGGSAYTRRQGLRRLNQRLENVPGASNIRYEPSAIKPTTVVVDVDIEMFLEEPFPRDTGRLEVVYRPREETTSSASSGSTTLSVWAGTRTAPIPTSGRRSFNAKQATGPRRGGIRHISRWKPR